MIGGANQGSHTAPIARTGARHGRAGPALRHGRGGALQPEQPPAVQRGLPQPQRRAVGQERRLLHLPQHGHGQPARPRPGAPAHHQPGASTGRAAERGPRSSRCTAGRARRASPRARRTSRSAAATTPNSNLNPDHIKVCRCCYPASCTCDTLTLALALTTSRSAAATPRAARGGATTPPSPPSPTAAR